MSDFNIDDPNLSTETYGWDNHKFSTDNLLNILRKEDITVSVHPGEGGANHAERRQGSIIAAMQSALKSAGASEAAQLFWEFFKALYSDRVAANKWSGVIYKGHWNSAFTPSFRFQTSAEELLGRLEDALGMVSKLNAEQFNRKFSVFIQDRTYNPMKTELQRLSQQYPDDLPEWPQLAQVLFGLTDKLSQTMLEKWLVAAVARAMSPGCQADNTLVLKGAQGIGKSTFFRTLGGEYFLDLDSATDGLEVKRQLAKSWVVELGEMEGITRKKEVEELKAFLTKTKDTYRGLYEKQPSDHPRHVVFGGSCNSDEILRDATGSRRFWILPCDNQVINNDFLRVNRGQLLATAYRKFENGFPYWADQVMAQQSEDRNQQYQETNEFQDQVAAIVTELSKTGAIAVKASDILTYGLGIPTERHKHNRHDRKVADALKLSGLVKKRIGQCYWVTPDAKELHQVFPADITKAMETLSSCPKRSEGLLSIDDSVCIEQSSGGIQELEALQDKCFGGGTEVAPESLVTDEDNPF